MYSMLLPLLLGNSPLNTQPATVWTDGRTLVGGMATFTANNTRCSPFNRLPAVAGPCAASAPSAKVSDGPWKMSRAPAGGFLQFSTDAPVIVLNATILAYLGSPITNLDTSLDGWAGFDLYLKTDDNADCAVVGPDGGGCWRWFGTESDYTFSPPQQHQQHQHQHQQSQGDGNVVGTISTTLYTKKSFTLKGSATKTFRLNLPTHVELQDIHIGVPTNYTVSSDATWKKRQGIAWYGTSILQSTAVSRPGQSVSSQLSRLLGRPIYNFGFNGCGTMELNMMQYLVQVEGVALFVIDCNWNMDAAMVKARTVPLVKYIRSAKGHAATPILLVSGTPYRKSWLVTTKASDGNPPVIVDGANGATTLALKEEYDALVKEGIKGLSFLNGSTLFDVKTRQHGSGGGGGGSGGGSDYDDPTFNSVHPNDLGHTLMTSNYLAVLPPLLDSFHNPPNNSMAPSTSTSTSEVNKAVSSPSGCMKCCEEPLPDGTCCCITAGCPVIPLPPSCPPPPHSVVYAKQEAVGFQEGEHHKHHQDESHNLVAPLPLPQSAKRELGRGSQGHPTLKFRWTGMDAVEVRGRAFTPEQLGPNHTFSRLPAAAQNDVRENVWEASHCSSGIALRFSTNASKIALQYDTFWTYGSTGGPSFPWIALSDERHWALSGLTGTDLYAYDTSIRKWRFVSACSWIEGCDGTAYSKSSETHVIADGLPRRAVDYMLHLPLYNGIMSGQIGAWSEDGTALIELPSHTTSTTTVGGEQHAIVWYGTSILQGAMAGRPGHQFTNVISRELDVEIFNFGFSGNGEMELAVANHLVAIKTPASVYLIDCIWNMYPEIITERTIPLVKFLQANGTANAHIVLVEGSPSGLGWAAQNQSGWPATNPGNVALRAQYELLLESQREKSSAATKLHYVNSSLLYERTVLYGAKGDVTESGVHPGDIGTRATADFWIDYLPTLLSS